MSDKTPELQGKLQALRPVLLTARGQPFLDIFDEFMEHREFDLALHAVCDFILDSDSPKVSASIIDQVRGLHEMMSINDSCVDQLHKLS